MRLRIAAFGVSCLVASGCGADDGGERTPVVTKPTPAPTVTTPASSGDRATSEPAYEPARETITTPDGAILRLPARPTRTVVAPSPSCTSRGPGAETPLPPRPGVTAERIAPRRLLVTVAFEEMPDRCLPDTLRITADVNGDPQAPSKTLFPIDRAERPIVVELPDRVAGADVVYASSQMRNGAASPPSAVLVQTPR